MSCGHGLEVCIDSLESAKNAVDGGADQLEVCSALELGGLTPSVGLVGKLRSLYPSLPLMCMLRNRRGNFIYTDDDIEVMEHDLRAMTAAGATGFVFGALDSDGNLQKEYCHRILKLSDGKPVTLHRAFDVTADWKNAVDDAVQMGFKAILTSGQKDKAMDGRELLPVISKYAGNRIRIIVGSGVNASTLSTLLVDTKCSWFHGSASKTVANETMSKVSMGVADGDYLKVTNGDEVHLMKQQIEEYFSR